MGYREEQTGLIEKPRIEEIVLELKCQSFSRYCEAVYQEAEA
jgi:hypothetical protein